MTVFSSYLKITEPFYSSGMDFKNSINSLAEILTLKKDTGLEVFSPCSYYKITYIGKKLIYGYSDNKKFMPDMPKKLKFEDIVEAVLFEHNQLKLVKAKEIEEAKKINIYEFNIYYNNNETLWKTIEVVDTFTLEDFGSEICICFAFENIFDYSFIIKDSNNFPVEYISTFSKRPSLNKTEKYKLSDININIGDVFTFNPTKEKELTLNIKCIGINKKNSNIVYPRIKAQSINITKEEEDMELI